VAVMATGAPCFTKRSMEAFCGWLFKLVTIKYEFVGSATGPMAARFADTAAEMPGGVHEGGSGQGESHYSC
jgi:hypothetical protein